jgi:ribosome-associated heat shock protein Hsp15
MKDNRTQGTTEEMPEETMRDETMRDEPSRMRADKFLWIARFFRSRAQAQSVLAAGRVRCRGRILDKGDAVKQGDVLTFTQGDKLRTVEILGFAPKRGNAADGQALYRDLYAAV